MGKRAKVKPAPVRKVRVYDILAEQTQTKPDEWTYVLKSSRYYSRGYRYWHREKDLYAKRNPEAQVH